MSARAGRALRCVTIFCCDVGQAHGRGTWRWDDGNLYEGEWKYGKKEGRGVFRWPAGDVYEGEWKDDKHEGLGMFRWASGSVY